MDDLTNLQSVEGLKESLEAENPPVNYSPDLYHVNACSQDEIIEWARQHAKNPWVKMVNIADKITRGEKLTAEEATVRICLTPFKIDYRPAYFLLRDTLGLLTFDPANLFTIILDTGGKKIIKAYFENTRYNNYNEMWDIDVTLPWMSDVEEFITGGKWEKLRPFLDSKMKESYSQPVNWVKIANINFFAAFKEVWDRLEDKEDLEAYISGVFKAVQKIYLHGWIKFTPCPPLFARLEELITGVLDIRPEDFKIVGLPPQHFVVGIRSDDYIAAINIGGPSPHSLLLPIDPTGELLHKSLPALAKHLAIHSGATCALAVDFRTLRPIIFDQVKRPLPRNNIYVSETSFGLILRFLKNYPSQWALWPEPLIVKKWVSSAAGILGIPFGIQKLSDRFLPRYTHRSIPLLTGHHTQFAFFILEGDRPVAAVVLEILNSGIKRIASYPVQDLEDIFSGMSEDINDIKDRLHRARFKMWDRVGWINYSFGIQKELISEMGSCLASGDINSVFRFFSLMRRAGRIKAMLKRGFFALYPDYLPVRIWKWVRKEGLLTTVMALLQITYDNKRSRGYHNTGVLKFLLLTAAVSVTIYHMFLQ